MKESNCIFTTARAALCGLAALSFSAAFAGDPYPLEYFALREVVSNVEVSPNGQRVAMLKILSRDGNPILHIHDTSDLEKKPIVIDADPMEIRSYGWINDSDIVFILRQQVRKKVEGQNEGVYENKITRLNLDKMRFEDFDLADPSVASIVENDPNKMIVSTQPGLEDDLSLDKQFRPRAYYKLDLRKGTEQLIIRGKIDLSQIEFDADGDPWLGRGFDLGKQEYVWYYREKGGKGWDDIYRQHEDSFEDFIVEGKDDAVPGNIIVQAQNGDNIRGLWSYNTKTNSFDELLYRRSDVDVYGTRPHSNNWTSPDRIAAVIYFKDKFHYEYFDEIEGATYAQLQQMIPQAHYTAIQSRSRDGNTFTVFNQGPRDPGTYYLYKDGHFTTLGSQQPLIDSEELADVEYITYKARDGRKIPAFLTVPNSEGPHPLVVLPHGGPFVHEIIIYDEWAQMLANNGYLVLQPQYRMSLGYGMEHFQTAFINGSEGGRKMQDDKDDGALYLIEQGLADPDRVAMFGWSYGGYAALIAASRTPQIYRCTIAGASIADPVRQRNEYRNDRGSGKILNDYRLGAVSPIKEVEKVNVPIMLIHGDVDQRVQIYQAKIYVNKLEQYDKPYKFVVLEGADHFYDTLFYEHQIKLYESIIDFLENDCFGSDSALQASSGE